MTALPSWGSRNAVHGAAGAVPARVGDQRAARRLAPTTAHVPTRSLAPVLLLSLALLPRAGLGATGEAPRAPARLFAALPAVATVALAPDGTRAAVAQGQPPAAVLELVELTGSARRSRLPLGRGERVDWLAFKSPTRLLAGVSRPVAGLGSGVRAARVLVVDPAGTELTELPRPRASDGLVQIVELVHRLPDDPRQVLLSVTTAERGRPVVYRVDVESGARSLVATSHPGISQWLADESGEVRVGHGVHRAGVARRTFVRPAPGRPWQLLHEDRLAAGELFVPVAIAGTPAGGLLVQSNHESGVVGLYRYDLARGRFAERLFRHPRVDITAVVMDPSGTSPLGVEFDDGWHGGQWFEPGAAALVAGLQARLDLPDVRIVATAGGLARVIVHAEAPDRPGRYFAYAPGTGELTPLADDYPELAGLPLSTLRTVDYTTRDGLRVQGYLATPAGHGGPAPLVVLPHGGPEFRDRAEFSPLVQLLASRGFAVFQPNFRGSSGYGAAFELAGRRQWGRAMQDDITDGTRWLVTSGVADPGRICIAGWSFGGYAALMGVIREPGLYRCAVSIAGVTDLKRLVRANSNTYLARQLTGLRLGRAYRDRAELAAHSPLERAAELSAPLLLVHGERDPVVPVAHARALLPALRRGNLPTRYLEVPGADHGFTGSGQRQQLFEAVDRFLAEQLAPAG